jgi:hypothetical protein
VAGNADDVKPGCPKAPGDTRYVTGGRGLPPTPSESPYLRVRSSVVVVACSSAVDSRDGGFQLSDAMFCDGFVGIASSDKLPGQRGGEAAENAIPMTMGTPTSRLSVVTGKRSR